MKNSLVIIGQRFCTALRFLTLLPVSWGAEKDGENFDKCLGLFPVVGVLIGAMGFYISAFFSQFAPASVTVVFALVLLAGISGGLHLDGLSDSADGLLCARPREEAMRIMKDSRAGVMGVIAVVFVVLLKFAALSSLPGAEIPWVVLLMPIAGRCAILITMARLPYARKEGGLGQLFYTSKTRSIAFLGFLFFCVTILLVRRQSFLPIIILFIMVIFLFNRWFRVKLGGATGDTLGAICELAETGCAVACSFMIFS
jgi:adenosylcobinamide-GDP ribazoletransferase